MRRAATLLPLLAWLLSGCAWSPPSEQPRPGDPRSAPLMWIQSALVPRGPHADAVSTLTWVMLIAGGLILLLVMALTAAAILLPERRRLWMTNHAFIVGLGILFPVVALTALLVYGFTIMRALATTPSAAVRVEVIGERWWWRVRYLDQEGAVRFVTANEIRLPVGKPIEFVLTTQDVIHSFWVPSLAGKLDMIPGRVNSYRFAAERPGIYRGQCAEYCGAQHALMAFYVVAMEGDAFEAWAKDQTIPAAEPLAPLAARGKALFLANGCGSCHRVLGTPAEGLLGPDLTHVGGRLSIAAGTLPTNVGTFAGWVSSSQHIKPENLMPSFGNLQGEELRAIAAYLESLK